MSYSIMKEQNRRTSRNAAVSSCVLSDRPASAECGHAPLYCTLAHGAGTRQRSEESLGRQQAAALPILPTSRRPLLDQLVGQQADSHEVHALREDEQSVMVLHDKPEQQQALHRSEGHGWAGAAIRGCH